MGSFFATFQKTLILFIFIAGGWGLRKCNMVRADFTPGLSKLIFNVFMPAMILQILRDSLTPQTLADGIPMLLLSCAVIVFGYVFGILASHLFEKKKLFRNIYIFSFTFSNFAFMGYPIMNAVFGQEIMLPLTLYNIPLYLVVNVLGLYIFTEKSSKKSESVQSRLAQLKVICNPVTVCIIIGIVLSFLHIQYPAPINEIIDMASVCVTPLSMLLTGFLLGNASLREMLCVPKSYVASLIRLLVLPLIVFAVFYLCGLRGNMLIIPVMISAMPVAVNGAVLSEASGSDSYSMAQIIFISTLLSLITLPLFASVLQQFV